jgi:hypothetical protein
MLAQITSHLSAKLALRSTIAGTKAEILLASQGLKYQCAAAATIVGEVSHFSPTPLPDLRSNRRDHTSVARL